MSTDLMNISAFKGLAPSSMFQEALDPQSESLADGIGSSYGIVGYKGKVWSLRLRGQSYMFIRPDGSPEAFLDVIILRSPGYKSKSYYPAGTFQDGALGTRPTCAALDGATPDADIAAPQSNSCSVCTKNVFKLNAEGRKSKECSDYKRLAVLILPSQTKALLGAPLMEPVFLRVPAASLNDLAQLGDGMSGMGHHFSSYITRIGFNPEKPHPQMTFRALQLLTNREAPLVLPLRSDPTAMRITGENETGTVRKLAPPAGAAVGPDPTIAAQALAAAQAKLAADLEAKERALAVAAAEAARQAAAKAAAEIAAASTVDTGFGDLGGGITVAVTQPAQAGPVATGFETGETTVLPAAAAETTQNTDADVGAAEPSDMALDERIRSLLPNLAS